MRYKRIAVTGPESTGKTELTELLAKHYNTVWVPEFARSFLNILGRPYKQKDLLTIAKGQLTSEKSLAEKSNGVVICDTDLIVVKVWSKYKFNFCDPWIDEMIDKHKYDFYLLCDIDTPWVNDPQRENPNDREELFNMYYKELMIRKLPFEIISGLGKQRLKNAVEIIDKHNIF